MATARRRPVERLAGRSLRTSSAPTMPMRRSTICSTWSSRRPPRSRSGKAMFSKTESESKSAPLWKTMVTRLRISFMPSSPMRLISSLSRWMEPTCGRRKPMRIRSETDLPTPLRPRMQRISPRSTVKLTSSRILRSSNEMETWLKETLGGGVSSAPTSGGCGETTWGNSDLCRGSVMRVVQD